MLFVLQFVMLTYIFIFFAIFVRIGYIRFPEIGSDDSPELLQVEKAKGYSKQLRVLPKDPAKVKGSRYVALHHFHPEVLLRYFNGTSARFPSYVSKELGKSIQLNKSERNSECKADNDDDYYYNFPTMSLLQAQEHMSRIITKHSYGCSVDSFVPRIPARDLKRRQDEEDLLHECEVKERRAEVLRANAQEAFNAKLSLDQIEYLASQDRKRCNIEKEKIDALEAQVAELKIQKSDLETRNTELEAYAYWGTQQGFCDVLNDHGGLCRANIPDLKYHEKNPKACQELFGGQFKSFRQLQVYLRCWFPNIFNPRNGAGVRCEKFNFHPIDVYSKNCQTTPLTDFEQCLLTLMRFQRRITLEQLALIWGRSHNRCSEIIQLWAPRLGKVGLNLSILQITPEFLEHAMPENFKLLGLEKVKRGITLAFVKKPLTMNLAFVKKPLTIEL